MKFTDVDTQQCLAQQHPNLMALEKSPVNDIHHL